MKGRLSSKDGNNGITEFEKEILRTTAAWMEEDNLSR